MKIDNTQSLSHTSYRCKYHIVIEVGKKYHPNLFDMHLQNL